MNAKQVLVNAADRIEKGWCTGAMAKGRQGNTVIPTSPEACSWCLLGAILVDDPQAIAADLLRGELERKYGGGSLVGFNDHRTKAEVLALLRETAASL